MSTLGLIVPPALGAVPSDGVDLYGGRIHFIARGLGIGGVSPEGFAPVIDKVIDRARELRDAGADVISLMGTSISFYQGPAFTESLRRSLHDATGLPCTTMSHAIVNALRALGIRRVAVATAYIDDLNRKLTDYLTDAGFTVTAIEGLSITGVREVGEVTTDTLVSLARRTVAQSSNPDGVFISCGGLQTLPAIRTLEAELNLPVTASSPAGFHDVVKLAGLDPRSPGNGRLFTLS